MSRSPFRDLKIILGARFLRLFAFGLVSIVLALFLAAAGFSTGEIGLLLTLTLVGDSLISIWLSTRADRWGRRRMLMVSGALMAFAGILMATTGNYWLLTLAAIVGVISPSGNEVGPFLPIEQAGLSQVVSDKDRTRALAWYNIVGYLGTALGALCGGLLIGIFEAHQLSRLQAYQGLLWIYGVVGLLVMILVSLLGPSVEAPPSSISKAPGWSGLHHSKKIVLRLSGLFAIDAFGGGFIIQSILAYWLHMKFGVSEAQLGGLFFGASLLSGFSLFLAVPLARRIGLINTMVFTHLPSNLLLLAVAFMPSFAWAAIVYLARCAISQMDVPTRQSYVMAIVPAHERSAANGVTNTVRTFASSLAPVLSASLMVIPGLQAAPFVIGALFKIGYDLALYRQFRSIKPPEEL